jgi:FixJ family two-component response regulator
MSGFTQIEMTERFATQDKTSFLQKPFTPSQLSDALRSVLEDGA